MKNTITTLLTCCFCIGLGSAKAAETSDQAIENEVNVALAKWGATATASSVFGAGYEASKVLDGKWADRKADKWNSAEGNGPHWLSIDLGATRVIHKLVIKHEGVISDGALYNTAAFQLQKADSAEGPWSDLVNPVLGNTEDVTSHEFKPVPVRYIRLLIKQGAQQGNQSGRIYEVEAYSKMRGAGSTLFGMDFPLNKFRSVEGKLEVQLRVEILSAQSGGKSVPVELQVNNGKRISLGALSSGQPKNVWIPSTKEPTEISIVVAGKKLPTRSMWTPVPRRDWGYFWNATVHLICSSHNDIAWFDTPAKTIERRDYACVTPALERMKKRDDVHFSMENVLYLQEYLERRPERKEEIAVLTKNGRFDWGATYNQPYEGLLSGEQLIRETYHGAKYIRKLFPGTPAQVAYNVDVPGRSMQTPQILSKAGIPYMVISRHKPGLFNWASPDGSEVLCWSMGHYYHYHKLTSHKTTEAFMANIHTGLTESYGGYRVPSWDEMYRQGNFSKNYPALFSEDYVAPPDFDLFVDETNAMRKEMESDVMDESVSIMPPKLKYSSTAEFFDSINKGSPIFETITGESPGLWLYIHGPTHHWAISAKRKAGVLLPAAEVFSTAESLLSGSFKDYPATALDEAWAASIYDDHGWGGVNGHITDEVFKKKHEKARDIGEELTAKATQKIASRIQYKKDKPITVFNALSWERTSPVRVDLAQTMEDFHIIDAAGKTIPHQRVKQADGKQTICFVAQNVPSLGYKTYYLNKGGLKAETVSRSSDTIENKFYKVTFGKGGITSIFDKSLEKDILLTNKFLGGEVFMGESNGYGAGRFADIQQPSMKGLDTVAAYKPEASMVTRGKVFSSVSFEQKMRHCTLRQQFVVYEDVKKIDCNISILKWDGTKNREFRMALPINMKESEISYEVPMGIVTVGKDEIKGAAGWRHTTPCKDIHPREVQNFITASGDGFGVTMSSSVAVCDWIDPVAPAVSNPVIQPILLVSRRSCHRRGNWYLQKGDHDYHFSITSHPSGREKGWKFAHEANNDLIAVIGATAGSAANLPEQLSFASASKDNVLISTVKKCEDDDSVIVRAYDIEGKDSEVELNTFFDFKKAEHTNIIEEEGKLIPGSGKVLKTKVGHHAIETFKLLPETE